MKLTKHGPRLICILGVCLLLWLGNPDQSLSQDLDRSQLLDHQIVSLAISPSKESVPALKDRLFPSTVLMAKRNAAIYYHRAVKIADSLPRQPDFGEGAPEDSYSIMFDAPLDELPLKPIKAWLAAHQQTLRELARAERSSECDWGLMPDELDEFSWFEASLQELQELRGLARMLHAKARVEMAEGRLSDAIKTLRMNYKMASDLGTSEVLIGDLIGIAIVGITNGGMRELIQQPHCPSLYWPLVSMPSTLVDTRKAILRELDVVLKGGGFGILNNPESKQLTVKQWQEMYFADALRMNRLVNSISDEEDLQQVKFGASMFLTLSYPVAKNKLIESGMSEEKVESMPVIQVVAIYQSRQNQIYHDEMAKVLNLPIHEASRQIEAVGRRLNGGSAIVASRQGMLPYLDMLLPACEQVMQAQARIETRVAALKIIEAIRLHLAATGELPVKLTDITAVPVPKNPSFDEPFEYARTDQGATLVAKAGILPVWQVYDITIAN